VLQNTQMKYVCLAIACLSGIVLSFTPAHRAVAQKILAQTGFEEFSVGATPDGWAQVGGGIDITDTTVKTGGRALVVAGTADGDALGVPLETETSIMSVEFWAYVQSGGRSFNLKVASADNISENNGGSYINWDADIVRLYDGSAWQEIGGFATDTWKYVRVVTDFTTSRFDFYAGDSREEVLAAPLKEELPFRNPAFGPIPTWVVFHVWSTAAPGYVDDLLVYEGSEPLSNLTAVEPGGKLAVLWGGIKEQ